MAQFWSDYADFLITSIDNSNQGKYKMQIRDLLSDPGKYASQQGIDVTVKNMKEDVNSYIDRSVASMPEEKTALEDTLSKADSITKQLLASISTYSKQYKVPSITPVSVERDTTKDEVISIDSANPGVIALVEKLVESSTLVADLSYTYEKAVVGSWLFSGKKNYLLNVFMPDNDVALLEAARGELNDLLDSALIVVQGV